MNTENLEFTNWELKLMSKLVTESTAKQGIFSRELMNHRHLLQKLNRRVKLSNVGPEKAGEILRIFTETMDALKSLGGPEKISIPENTPPTEFCYGPLVKLGFKRFDSTDKEFFDKQGHFDFCLIKKLGGGLRLYWNADTHHVHIQRLKKGKVLREILIENREYLDLVIELFKKEK